MRFALLTSFASLAASVTALGLVLAACSGEDGAAIADSRATGDSGSARSSIEPASPDPAASAAPSRTDGGSPGFVAADAGDAGNAADAADAAPPPDETGEATYFNVRGAGPCGLPSLEPSAAALNSSQFDNAACGRCVAVTGPHGTTVARIVDECTTCDHGDLDLSRTAFSKIAKLSAGRVPITWHFAPCP